MPVNDHLTSCFTRNTNTYPEVISVGSTVEDATEDHESPMDERGARRADRFMLCPSVLVPNNSHTNQMFSSGSKGCASGTKTDSINKISNNDQQKAGGGNQYFRSSQVVETRAKTSINHVQLDNLHVHGDVRGVGSRSPAITAQSQQQLVHLTADSRQSLTR